MFRQTVDAPLRQVGFSGQRQRTLRPRAVEPFGFGAGAQRAQFAAAVTGDACKPEQQQLAWRGVRCDVIEQQLATQDAEDRFGDKGTVLLAQCFTVAKIAAELGVWRIFLSQYAAQRAGGFIHSAVAWTRARVDYRLFGFLAGFPEWRFHRSLTLISPTSCSPETSPWRL